MSHWIAVVIAGAWGVSYIVAILQRDDAIIAAATPVVMLALGTLLKDNKNELAN